MAKTVAGIAAIVALIILGLTWHFHNVSVCHDRGGHVDWTSHGDNTSYYCLTDDGRVLKVWG